MPKKPEAVPGTKYTFNVFIVNKYITTHFRTTPIRTPLSSIFNRLTIQKNN